MDWTSIYPLLKSLWVIWFFLVFIGIVAWALWPSRRKRLEKHGEIPLRNNDET